MTHSVDQERPNGRPRGAPLVLLCLLVIGWVSARAAVWENPFPASWPAMPDLAAEGGDFPKNRDAAVPGSMLSASPPAPLTGQQALPSAAMAAFPRTSAGTWQATSSAPGAGRRYWSGAEQPRVAGRQSLSSSAAQSKQEQPGGGRAFPSGSRRASGVPRAAPPTSIGSAKSVPSAELDRWSFDAFSFHRAGSGSEAVSAGRVAIYGASQSGARLQYRFAPGSRRDPRAFVRAYQAHVSGGESELAAGLSVRPVPSMPLRAYGEVRLTDTALFGRTVRPAAYAVTEIAPVSLPLDVALELYGGAGYVGGTASTLFADGQAVGMREVASFRALGDRSLRISVGGGAWGGVQRDAGRLDIGPTMRVDFDLGKIPARVSVDWRERVAGEAEPGSGVAATLSTQF